MELWQDFRIDEQVDATCGAGFAGDPSLAIEGKHHLMDGGRGDSEEALHVGFGGWAAHDERIGMDEGQILALLVGEAWILGRSVHVT